MSRYRRRRIPGGTYFFTVRLQDRQSCLLIDEIDRLRQATRLTLKRYPTQIDAIVVLPAVIHTLWSLPEGDADYSKRWSMLKSLFSRGLPASENRTNSQQKHRNKGIWQRRFWEHSIRDSADFATYRDLILNAPVQYGLVRQPQDWPYSSIHRDLGSDRPKTPHPATQVERFHQNTLSPKTCAKRLASG